MSRSLRFKAGVGLVGSIVGLWLLAGGAATSARVAAPAAAHRALPRAAVVSISRYLGGSESAYWARRAGNGWAVAHKLGGYSVRYSATGARLTGTSGAWLEFSAARRDVGVPVVSRNRVSYRSAAVSVWFADGPAGLEQGFTLQSPPQAAARGGEITLPVTTLGTLRPVRRDGAIEFVGRGGRPVLSYGGLSALDARGHDLRASLSLSGGRLQIEVATRGASYPIAIDPTIAAVYSVSTLTDAASAQTANSNLGASVAVDGSTVVVGEPNAGINGHQDCGVVDIFSEGATGWAATQTPAAVLQNPQPSDCNFGEGLFGASVAIAGPTGAQTLVAVAPADSNNTGVGFAYSEPAGGWTGTIAAPGVLTSQDNDSPSNGMNVAIAGNTVAIGRPDGWAISNGDSGAGTVELYTETSGMWSEIATLSQQVGSNMESDSGIGASVALANTPGGTVVVAGSPDWWDPGLSESTGGALVWVEPSGGWEGSSGNNGTITAALQPSFVLPDPFFDSEDEFGDAVAIDPTGSLIVAGAPLFLKPMVSSTGFVGAFAEPNSGWASDAGNDTITPSAILEAAVAGGNQQLGEGVATDGGTVWATEQDFQGASGGNISGAVLKFAQPSGGWAAQGGATLTESADLVPAGSFAGNAPVTAAYAGNSAALAADPTGATVVAGALSIEPMASAGGAAAGGAFVWGTAATVPKPSGTVTVTGIDAAGETLSCHANNWTGSPTLTYQWTLNGHPIPGATGAALKLNKGDADGSIICTVTGTNAGGSTTVDSRAVHVGVCVVATGSMHGDVLGPVHLGEAANSVLGLFPKQNQTHYGTQRFCVVGGDERVEFPTEKLLNALKPELSKKLRQRVVMELTANPIYEVDGVRHGMNVKSAGKKLRLGTPFKVGANTWYLVRNHGDDILIKTQGKIVREIGFLDKRLIAAGGLVKFFSTFLNSGISL